MLSTLQHFKPDILNSGFFNINVPLHNMQTTLNCMLCIPCHHTRTLQCLLPDMQFTKTYVCKHVSLTQAIFPMQASLQHNCSSLYHCIRGCWAVKVGLWFSLLYWWPNYSLCDCFMYPQVAHCDHSCNHWKDNTHTYTHTHTHTNMLHVRCENCGECRVESVYWYSKVQLQLFYCPENHTLHSMPR